MEVVIKGSPEEIAALILAVQGRPSETLVDAVAGQIAAGLKASLSSI